MSKNALDVLMNSNKKKRPIVTSVFFDCPLGCGAKVTEQDVNTHLDHCIGKHSSTDNNSTSNYNTKQTTSESINTTKRTRLDTKTNDAPNVFSHMMKQSASVFKKNNIIRHRFHLHNVEGYVTWATNYDENTNIKDKESWSATTKMKKVKTIELDNNKTGDESINDDRELELTISSSVPCLQGDKRKLVCKHSRLSISHLKSCLQKCIRRRQPLPAVRVGMELADKSYADLIRRLPIIVLEDSFLHPDFGLLVWLMVAESKGYYPCCKLLKRVFQIVFEMASCARQDQCDDEESIKRQSDIKLPVSLSLKTPTNDLFSDAKQSTTHINSCEVIIRSMLLRVHYGGMKCDCQMLYSYAITWLRRFQLVSVPASLERSLSTAETTLQSIHWFHVPQLLHSKAYVQSEELITSKLICSNGISKLTAMDVCSAGIDFHCSNIVEHLLSKRELYIALSERLAKLKSIQVVADREWISDQLKSMIWNFSSGVNHRRFLLESQSSNKVNDTEMKAIWNEVVKQPFDIFTKKFVRDRLAFY